MVEGQRSQASLVGTVFAGHEILGLVGRGAVGTVYLARDVKLDRYVALKVLLGSLALSRSTVRRFHAEAQAAAPLRHPNIVRLYTAGIEQGTPYIAMEYIEGETLGRFLSRKRLLRWQDALYIGHQIAAALSCAHGAGVVHRDVKPANVMLDRRGRVLLTDFGIANMKADHRDITEEDTFLGTPHYMSPEQCDGRQVTASSDLFSLGVVLYQMIRGQLPFDGDSATAIIQSIAHDTPPRLNRVLPEVPDDVARLVAHLMEKDPEARPQSAAEVGATIERLYSDTGGVSAVAEGLAKFVKERAVLDARGVREAASPAVSPKRGDLTPRPRRRWVRSLAVAVSVLVAVGAIALAWWVHGLPAEAAPNLESFIFEDAPHGAVIARFPVRGFRFTDLCWVGDKPTVLIRAEGIEGTLTQGASGLLTVAPVSRSAFSLRSPSAPAVDPLHWQARIADHSPLAVPATPPGAPLDGMVLVPMREKSARQNRNGVVIRGQLWNAAVPNRSPLYRGEDGTWMRESNLRGTDAETGCVVASPDGHTLCVLVYDETHGANYLVERDVRSSPPDRVGPHLTTLGKRLIPTSIRYSPDGTRIAYMREADETNRELWCVASGGGEVNGTLLARGPLEIPCAFSPDGMKLAVCSQSKALPDPEVILVDTRDGTVTAQLGAGRLGNEPWSPDGRHLFVAALPRGAAPGGRRQLWAVETRPPHRRIQLTNVREGIQGGCAVARDGIWAAALLEEDTAPAVLFLELRSFPLEIHT